MPSLFFIAGDPSGDLHAAAVVSQLRLELTGSRVWGIGGPAMVRAGFEPVMPFAPFNRMGFLEVALHIGFFLRAQRRCIRLVEAHKPSVMVCVDYSGFNIPLMRAAAARGVPVVWYIAPMVWAWKKKRAAVLGRHAAHIAVIFPFEVSCFSPFRAPVSFVGNPTVEAMAAAGLFLRPEKVHPGNNGFHLALVPGSRRQEIEHQLPRMLEACAILRQRFPRVRASVSRYGALPESFYQRYIGGAPVALVEGPLSGLLNRADCALVTSGTATLETALLGVPHIVTYHTSAVTYELAKRLIRVKHIGLPNIIAGETIVPECIQDQAEGANLALTLERFIESPKLYNSTVNKLLALRTRLGEKKPSEEVCRIITNLLVSRKR
ncbi:MAG: lipid-A-disaccharide synthase [Chitinispirillaceae bacterium]|nr:lipid-A-disaccharide synthase [Chitinispirillaceae bacterium]